MADEVEHVTEVQTVQESTAGKWILIIIGVLYIAGSLFFLFNLKGRADAAAKAQSATDGQVEELTKRMQAAEADSEALATQLGMTKKELAEKSDELQRQQRAAEQRLAQEQKLQSSKISQVSGDVAGVKNDLGGQRPTSPRPKRNWLRPKPSCKVRSATWEYKAASSRTLATTSRS